MQEKLNKIIKKFKEIKKKIKFKNYELPKKIILLDNKDYIKMNEIIYENFSISLITNVDLGTLQDDYKELCIKIYDRLLQNYELQDLDYNDVNDIVYKYSHEIDSKLKYVVLTSLISNYEFKNDKLSQTAIFSSIIFINNMIEAFILKDNNFSYNASPVIYHEEYFICFKILEKYLDTIHL